MLARSRLYTNTRLTAIKYAFLVVFNLIIDGKNEQIDGENDKNGIIPQNTKNYSAKVLTLSRKAVIISTIQ